MLLLVYLEIFYFYKLQVGSCVRLTSNVMKKSMILNLHYFVFLEEQLMRNSDLFLSLPSTHKYLLITDFLLQKALYQNIKYRGLPQDYIFIYAFVRTRVAKCVFFL